MNVLLLQGSPRKNGNTATLAHALVDGLGSAVRLREVFLHDQRIAPCASCNTCRSREGIYCTIDDDMQPLYREFLEADLVVMATPVYWWSISSQLKVFIDRLYGLNCEQYPERYRGKKLAVLLSHGDAKPCSGAKIALQMFKEIVHYTGMKLAGTLEYSSADRPARDSPQALAEARALGVRLSGA
jgi:multimeric flavodoxin WrbA